MLALSARYNSCLIWEGRKVPSVSCKSSRDFRPVFVRRRRPIRGEARPNGAGKPTESNSSRSLARSLALALRACPLSIARGRSKWRIGEEGGDRRAGERAIETQERAEAEGGGPQPKRGALKKSCLCSNFVMEEEEKRTDGGTKIKGISPATAHDAYPRGQSLFL